MPSIQLLRLVVASPGDTQAERALVPVIAEELNRGIARDRNLRLEVTLWETAGSPGFHPLGPQGHLDPILDIDNCDLLIGIFWKRFGTPLYDAQSGTEHEFWRAYRAWQAQGRPQILMYFNDKAATPKTSEEAEQWMRVLKFREAFPQEGLAWEYDGEQAFERLLRQHLTRHILEDAPHATAPRPPVSSAPGLPDSLRLAYLHWIIAHVRHVPLTGVDPQAPARRRAETSTWPRCTPP